MKQRKSAIKYTSRHQLIDRLRRELEHRGYPRLQMSLLVALTGGAGFLASYGLLHAGLETLSWRYGLSVGIAYGFFCCCCGSGCEPIPAPMTGLLKA